MYNNEYSNDRVNLEKQKKRRRLCQICFVCLLLNI